MQFLSLIHQEDADPGVFSDELADLGHDHEIASYALGRSPARDPLDYDAVIVFGGSANVDQEERHPWLRDEKRLIGELIDARRPLLGVCLGAQLIAGVAGGRVEPLGDRGEVGWYDVELLPAAESDPLLRALPSPLHALEWHHYGAAAAPPGATELARNGAGLQAFRIDDAPAWGIQFHAEVTAATLARWMREDGHESRVELEAFAEQNERELPRWNEQGRSVVRGFATAAAATR